MHLRRMRAALAAVVALFALAACTSTPGVPDNRPPQRVEIAFHGLGVTMEVPARFGQGSLDAGGREDCPQELYRWKLLPSGSSDDSELLAVGTTRDPCPDEQPVNGRFPTWAETEDLPEDAEPVPVPKGEGHRFSFTYTQCTNECGEFGYDVVFVELPDGRSFWIQSSGVDRETVEEIVASLKVDN